MNIFGDYIKRLRKYSNMTQEQLAEKMDVSQTTIQNWESGRTKVKPAHLKNLAYLFNVSEASLISELNRENDLMRSDIFPFFLFNNDEELSDIIKSLHLNLNQQELFGLICLYYPDVLENYADWESVFDEALTKIPYDFICKVGSLQYMKLADGLRNVLKYVQPKFLLKVLKLYPDELFDVTRLSKDLIIEFLDSGHVPPDMFEIDDMLGFDFDIKMKKAKIVLPILEKYSIHLADGDRDFELAIVNKDDEPLSEEDRQKLNQEIGQKIIDATWFNYDHKRLVLHILEGLKGITTISYDESDPKCASISCQLEINDLGRELLEWFRKKE